MTEYLGVVLNHLDRLVPGFLEVAVERGVEEAGSIAEQFLVHAEELSLRPDFDLDDGIEGVSAQLSAVVAPPHHHEGPGLQARSVCHVRIDYHDVRGFSNIVVSTRSSPACRVLQVSFVEREKVVCVDILIV